MWFSFLEDLEIHRFVVVCIGNGIFFNNNCGLSTDMRTNKPYIHTYSQQVHKNWHCNVYMIYSVTLSSRVCLSIKFWFFVDFCPFKGQLISKCLFGHIVRNAIWLKKNRASDNEGKFHSFFMCRIWIYSEKLIS